MKYENDGMRLWFGTADAPAPLGTVEAEESLAVHVAVQPIDASHRVDVRYRSRLREVDGVVAAAWWCNDPQSDTAYFRATLPAFEKGDRISYTAVCSSAGRQVPGVEEARLHQGEFGIGRGQATMAPAIRRTASAPTGDLLTGYDMVAAVTQNGVNSQLLLLWREGVIKPNFLAKMKAGTVLSATMAAPTVSFMPPDNNFKNALFQFELDNGSFEYWEIGNNGPVKTTVKVQGWVLAFTVDLGLAGVSYSEIEAAQKSGTVSKTVPTALKSYSDPQLFSINNLFLDFENANFDDLDPKLTKLPGLPPPSVDPYARSQVTGLLSAYFTGLKGSANPYILGYSIASNSPANSNPQQLPSFVPTSVNYSTTGNKTSEGLSTVNYLVMTAQGNGKPTPPPSGSTAGIFNQPWVTDNTYDGALMLSQSVFMEDYLIPKITAAIANPKPFTRQGSGLVWQADHFETNRPVWHHIFLGHKHVTTTYTNNAQISLTPGSPVISMTGTIQRSSDIDVEIAKIPFTCKLTATQNWTNTITITTQDDGTIGFTVKTTIPKLQIEHHKNFGGKLVDDVKKLIDTFGIKMEKSMKGLNASLGGEIDSQLKAMNAHLLASMHTNFILPTGQVFFLKDAIFNEEGDLRLNITYESDPGPETRSRRLPPKRSQPENWANHGSRATRRLAVAPTQLDLTTASSLMENYQAGWPVDPGKAIGAVQDAAGNPMIFTIGSEGSFNLIMREKGGATDWRQIDLTQGIDKDTQAQAFAVSQDPGGDIFIAVAAVTPVSPKSAELFFAGPLSNDPKLTDWDALNEQWVVRPGNPTPNAAITEISIGSAWQAGQSPMVLVSVSGGTQPTNYSVNADPSQIKNLWYELPPPTDAASILDIKPGAMPTTGPGFYTLYLDNGKPALVFASLPNQYGRGYDVPLQAPAGAKKLASTSGSGGTTGLYVAGSNGLAYFAPNNQHKNAQPVALAKNIPVEDIEDFFVREDAGKAGTVAVWLRDTGSRLAYITGSKGDSKGWTYPLILRGDVAQLAALRNAKRFTNEMAIVGLGESGKPALFYLWQDPNTTLWKQGDIPLTASDKVQKFNCYTTHLRLRDQQGQPFTQPVQLSASEWSYVVVNGIAHVLDRGSGVTVSADPSGTLTIINKVNGIASPVFRLQSPLLTEAVDIHPGRHIVDRLSAFKTGADLKAAKTQTGKPLISGSTALTPDDAAKALQSLVQLHGTLPQTGGSASTSDGSVVMRPYGSPIGNGIDLSALPDDYAWGLSFDKRGARFHDADSVHRMLLPSYRTLAGFDLDAMETDGFFGGIKAIAGDVLEALKHDLEKAGSFVLKKLKDGMHFLINLEGTVFSFLIKTIEQVGKLLSYVLKQLYLDLKKIIDWIGFLFDWDDIVKTHKVFANVARTSLSYGKSKLAGAENAINRFFKNLEGEVAKLGPIAGPAGSGSLLSGSANPLPGNKSGAKTHHVVNTPGGNFANYHVSHSGMLSAAPGFNDTGDPIMEFFEDVILPAARDIQHSFTQIMDDLYKDFKAGDSIDDIIQNLEIDVLTGILESLRLLAVSFLKIAEAVIDLIQGSLEYGKNIPFISSFYKLISGGDAFTILDGLALLFAIPTTLLYKALSGRAPFEDGTFGLEKGSYQQVFGLLEGNPSPMPAYAATMGDTDGAPSKGALVYSQVGGSFALVAQTVNRTISGINTEIDDASPIGVYIALMADVLTLASTFPVGNTKKEYLDWQRGIWGFDLVALLRYVPVILAQGSGGGGEDIEEFSGGVEVFTTVVKLILDLVVFGYQMAEDDADERALDGAALVSNIVHLLGNGFDAAAKFDDDIETKTLLNGISLALGWTGEFVDVVRFGVTLADDEHDKVYPYWTSE